MLHETFKEMADAAAVIQLMVLQASYESFFQFSPTAPSDQKVNQLDEFTEYATAREVLAGRETMNR